MRWSVWMGCFGALVLATGCDRQEAKEASPPKAVVVQAGKPLKMKLLTFNLRYENETDEGDWSWPQRVLGIVRMVRREAPDVMGVQEARHGQAADLRASLPDYEFFGVGRDNGGREGEYAGIYYRADRFEADPGEGGHFWLSDEPERPGSMTWGNNYPRVVTWLRLIERSSGHAVYVFNTHWDHRNQPVRERSAMMMAERIDARRHGDEPVVVLGDFNAVEGNAAMRYLTGKQVELAGAGRQWRGGLLDTYRTRHPGAGERRTFLWRGRKTGSFKIDHILVSKGARVLEAEILDEDGPVLSDHYPVTAEVSFPP